MSPGSGGGRQDSVQIAMPGDRVVMVAGDLVIPPGASGLVIFAHGSGSSRLSPRNRHVAASLQAVGLGTLLTDLLTAEEEQADALTGQLRFDIGLLARRLVAAAEWVHRQPDAQALRLGYFGASTGGGAALAAAAQRPDLVRAVVSRGGRPDLAGSALTQVQVPTLLIVGGRDEPVIQMNRDALRQLRCEVSFEIVAGATHLFEEPGALERVAQLARDWFVRYLAPTQVPLRQQAA